MTLVQKLTVKISETRQALNELAGKKTLEDGDAAKIEELRKELNEKEVQFRAAVVAEGDEETRALGLFNEGDAESAEKAKLLKEVRIADYLGFAASSVGLSGRAAELNAALEVGPSKTGAIEIPWRCWPALLSLAA